MNRKVARYLLISIILGTVIAGILCWIKVSQSKIELSNNISSTYNYEKNLPIELPQATPCIMLFFNSQCDLCLAEIEVVKKHIRDLSNLYSVFFISFEPKQSINSFLTNQGINICNNIHIVADEKMVLLDQLKIKGYPSYIILSRDHKIKSRGTIIDQNMISRLLKLDIK